MHHLPKTAAAALAAAAALPAPLAQAGDWGGIFSAVMLTTDYRYQGVSNSDRHPALQGYVHYWRPDGYYAGVFATQVDYNDPGHTAYELDYYAGKNFRLEGGKSELKLEAMYTAFPDNKTPGPTYDFLQLKVGARRTAGKLTLNGVTSFVPEGSYRGGQIWRVEGEAAYAVAPHLTLKALAGHQWAGHRPDRSYWSLGGVATWKTLALDLRYQDTDLSRSECGFNPDVCGPAVVGTLTINLPPIL
jgi:uncharacterized protein (TIGR02001 family)